MKCKPPKPASPTISVTIQSDTYARFQNWLWDQRIIYQGHPSNARFLRSIMAGEWTRRQKRALPDPVARSKNVRKVCLDLGAWEHIRKGVAQHYQGDISNLLEDFVAGNWSRVVRAD